MRKKLNISSYFLVLMVAFMALFVPISSVYAGDKPPKPPKTVFISDEGTVVNDGEKLVICHRDKDVKKPYVSQSEPFDAINGEGRNDHTSHTGDLAYSIEYATSLKKDGDKDTKWGDIIPPFTYGNYEYDGYIGPKPAKLCMTMIANI